VRVVLRLSQLYKQEIGVPQGLSILSVTLFSLKISLVALSRFQLEQELVQKIIKDYVSVTKSSKRTVLC